MEKTYVVPTENDVLCGSGNDISQHRGNIRFRRIVASHYERFAVAVTKTEKMKVTRRIINEVLGEAPGVRFLKRHPIFQKWYGAELKVGKDKISHSLREIKMTKQAETATGQSLQHLIREQAFVDQQMLALLVNEKTKQEFEEQPQQQLQQQSQHMQHQLPVFFPPTIMNNSPTQEAQHTIGTASAVSSFSSPSLGSRFIQDQDLQPPLAGIILPVFSMLGGPEAQEAQGTSFDTYDFSMAKSQISAWSTQRALSELMSFPTTPPYDLWQNQKNTATLISGDATSCVGGGELLFTQAKSAPHTATQGGAPLVQGSRPVSVSFSVASVASDLIRDEYPLNNASSLHDMQQQGVELTTEADRVEGSSAQLFFELEDLVSKCLVDQDNVSATTEPSSSSPVPLGPRFSKQCSKLLGNSSRVSCDGVTNRTD